MNEGLIFTYAYSGNKEKEKIQSYIKENKLDYEVDYNNIVLSIQDELSIEYIDDLLNSNKIDNRIKIIYATLNKLS
ncbi:hypothetical protein [Clostridium tagluense]|uniref:Uncharacterized protein n=1 Tax=Clostridium tagluense TaxID=360422 RepID=A0A401UU75_9CLOT|nr:hypothetical protein [Clostridium tagluense]GCD13119.1 hypothetical protein Ctaglu_47420 [Clostridium tagluense]